jgi:hypothetical protein
MIPFQSEGTERNGMDFRPQGQRPLLFLSRKYLLWFIAVVLTCSFHNREQVDCFHLTSINC